MNANATLSAQTAGELESLLRRHGSDSHALVQILREFQAIHGWLPRPALQQIARSLGLTLAHVQGVADFYRFFHTEPVGAYRVLFSDNITDRMLGSEALLRQLCGLLKVAPNQMRADGRVSVATTSCTGLCDQGPAALINHHQVVTRLTPERIEHMAALIEQQVPARAVAAGMVAGGRPDSPGRRQTGSATRPRRKALPPPWRAGPRPCSTTSSAPNCAAAAAPGMPPAPSGNCAATPGRASPLRGVQRRRGRARHLQGPGAAQQLRRHRV